MSYFDPNIYRVENLKSKDKKIIEALEELKGRILSKEQIEEYIEENSSNTGETGKSLLKETLTSYNEFLKEQIDYCECDIIIDKIDEYSDKEWEKIKKNNNMEKIKKNNNINEQKKNDYSKER